MWWLAAVVLGACLGSPALAQTSPQSPVQVQPAPPGTPLTLEDALAQGLANSQRLAELEARAAAAAASRAGRAAARLPSVSLLGGYTRTNHVTSSRSSHPAGPRTVIYPDIPDNYRARVDLQWPIYTGGRADALERAARAEREPPGRIWPRRAPTSGSRSRARSGRW